MSHVSFSLSVKGRPHHFSGEQIDLQPDIAEQVILALPIKPLCSAACKGLCPTCGVDLNKDKCRCNIGSVQQQVCSPSKFKISEEIKS